MARPGLIHFYHWKRKSKNPYEKDYWVDRDNFQNTRIIRESGYRFAWSRHGKDLYFAVTRRPDYFSMVGTEKVLISRKDKARSLDPSDLAQLSLEYRSFIGLQTRLDV